MEEFWDNVKDIFFLLLKVSIILLALDLVCVALKSEMRVPYIMMITDWLFAKAAVFVQ